ncbi:MAG: GTPase, partial [Dokdonella sp.]
PTLRRINGLACGPIVLADTVGFIRDLPHDLVAAFRATLAEARDADLLLHVVDASDPDRDRHINDVESVLAEIGAEAVPQLMVFNKIDRLEDLAPRLDEAAAGVVSRVWVSALKNLGIDGLREAMGHRLSAERIHTVIHLPVASGRLRARLHELGLVAGERQGEAGWELEIDAPRALIEPLYGLGDGDGERLRSSLLAPAGAPTYNQHISAH